MIELIATVIAIAVIKILIYTMIDGIRNKLICYLMLSHKMEAIK